MPSPEDLAREKIDALLHRCGWVVQDKSAAYLAVSRGVALRELSFKMGEPDYTLFVDGKAIGTVEAKPEGHSLTGVEEQSKKYVKGVPFGISAWRSPLPFCYESTGPPKFVAQETRTHRCRSGPPLERGGGTGNGRERQPPTRHPPPPVDFAAGV